MEFAGMSGVIMMVVLFYIFRKPIKRATDIAPEAVEYALNAVVKSSRQLDTVVSTNCAENELDCRLRMKTVVERIKTEELPSVDEAYDFVMGIGKK